MTLALGLAAGAAYLIGCNDAATGLKGSTTPAFWFTGPPECQSPTSSTIVSNFNAGTTLNLPDAVISFSASATTATTVFNAGANRWETTVPLGYYGNAFLGGMVYQVPPGGPHGGAHPVSWTGSFVSAVGGGYTFQWKWGAAVYTTFGIQRGRRRQADRCYHGKRLRQFRPRGDTGEL